MSVIYWSLSSYLLQLLAILHIARVGRKDFESMRGSADNATVGHEQDRRGEGNERD